MPNSSTGSAGVALLLVLAGLALAAANLVLLVGLGPDGVAALDALRTGDLGPLLESAQTLAADSPATVALIAGGPLLLGVLAAFLAGRRSTAAPTTTAEEAPAATAGPPPENAALQLLAMLQQEARFIDFLQEDIDGYDDAQVGAAVREIHADCRKAIAARVEIARIYEDEEGSEVDVAKGFDPAAVRLTGNVHGEPPFRGSLQHCGWRVAKVQWPTTPGSADAKILAPAEVEIA